MSTQETQDPDAYEHDHAIEPDPQPEEVHTAILEEDADQTTSGSLLMSLVFGVALFLIILLVWSLGSGRPLFGNAQERGNPLLQRQIADPNQLSVQTLNNDRVGITGLGFFPDGTARPAVDPLFDDYWLANGGVEVFGLPESTLLVVNGRQIQWFERARLEYWPENESPYNIQPGRIGTEFTDDRDFPKQAFFANRPGLMYVKETEHGIADPFLSFWQQRGALRLFGYPISDAIQEILPEDGLVHTVQYFERVRLEHHPNDPNQPIKIGLLGASLYRLDSQPAIVEPVPAPTTVPILR